MSEQPDQRIAVIGSPGSGKSTLAAALARATGLPLTHLDREYWLPGWIEPARPEWLARHALLVARDRWIIDGNYGGSLPARLLRATCVVWLDLPTHVCLVGALRRASQYRDGGRADMAEDCPERFDRPYLAFLHYIATFRRRKRAGIGRALASCRLPVVHLTSTGARGAFLRLMEAGDVDGAMASPG